MRVLESLINSILTVFGFLVLGALSLADRIEKKKKKTVPAAPGLRPEEAERPYPLPHRPYPVTPDRPTHFASPSDRIGFALASARARRKDAAYHRWMADVAMEIEEMTGEELEEGF